MTQVKKNKSFALLTALTLLLMAGAFAGLPRAAMGQSPASSEPETAPQDSSTKVRPRTTDDKSKATRARQGAKPEETATTPSEALTDAQANRKEEQSEENAVVPYYNNFF